MYSAEDTACAVGFPIRTSPGQSQFADSPELFAGYHVLHRLLSPRHSPYVLNHLTIYPQTVWLTRSFVRLLLRLSSFGAHVLMCTLCASLVMRFVLKKNTFVTKYSLNSFCAFSFNRDHWLLTIQCDIPGSCSKNQEHDHLQDKMRALSCGIIFTAFLIVKEHGTSSKCR